MEPSGSWCEQRESEPMRAVGQYYRKIGHGPSTVVETVDFLDDRGAVVQDPRIQAVLALGR